MATLQPSAPSTPRRLPYGMYKVRIKEEPKFGVSNTSGNKRLEFTYEVVSPATVTVQGETIEVAGIDIKHYPVVEQGKSQAYEAICRQCQFGPEALTFDDNTGLPPVSFTGREIYVMADSKEEPQKDGNGEPIISGVTGKPVTSFRHNVRRVDGQ